MNRKRPFLRVFVTLSIVFILAACGSQTLDENSETEKDPVTPGGHTPITDLTAPNNATITINNDAATTNTTSVTLNLSASDNVGVTAYYSSETNSAPAIASTSWVSITSSASYSANASFTLSSGDGSKTVYVWFKDAVGNISTVASDSIQLSTGDTTAPISPSVSINGGAVSTTSTSVTLTLSASDNVGVTAYFTSENSTTPSQSVSGWTAVTSTTSYSGNVSFTLSSGTGTKTVYAWFKDAAGNVSSSANDTIQLNTGSSVPTTGLIAYYPFNGNADDESGFGNNGSVVGATLTTDKAGSTNNAYFFDGASSYIGISHDSVFDVDSISISVWIYQMVPPSGYHNGLVISKNHPSNSQNNNHDISILVDSIYEAMGDYTIWLYSTTTGIVYSQSGTFNNSGWHHIVFTSNGGTEHRLYIDGNFERELNYLDWTLNGNSFDWCIGSAGLDGWYYGKIDELRMYNRVLDSTEINELFLDY